MKVRGVALGLLLGLAMMGCAEEREPIDRVQPNVLKKSFFVGEDLHDSSDDPEFFMRAYSVGSSYDQPSFYYGTGSGVDRVRFEITENMLLVRKAYQIGRGRDDKGLPGGEANGTVVAAYRIESHFDIRKAYNPVTGEELNITEENTSDRPWYEREYFRVDWSTNEVANPMYLDELFSKWFGDPKITPMRYQVTDPTSEDAPFVDEKEGYIEVTNRVFVEPGEMYFSWGSLPSCIVYGMISGTNINDCNMQAANLRLTYWRIDPNRDFEPFINSLAAEDVVNNFGTAGSSVLVQWGAPISDYDPAYGFTDKGYHIPMHVINIWEKSHVDIACTSNDDGNNDGTADQCERYVGSKGSRCDTFISWKPHEIKGAVAAAEREGRAPEEVAYIKDVLSKAGKCTIPYRDRKVKTLGWWVNKEMPFEYQDTLDANGNPMDRGAVEDVVYTWNQMFTAAVAMARSAECRRTGDGDRGQCHGQYFHPEKRMVSYGGWLVDWPVDETPVFTLCHNPVRGYDHATCGKAGATARTGDLRKFMLIDWPWATNSPFGGVTDLHSDPTTGELIGNTSLTVHIESRASRMLDTLLVAMGDMTLDEYMAGGSHGRYAKVMSGPLPAEPLSDAEIQKRIEAIDTFNLAQSAPSSGGVSQSRVEVAKAAMRAKLELKADQDLRKMQALRNDQLLKPLRNTPLEHDLMDAAWLKAAKLDPSAQLTDSVMNAASPLRGLDAAKMQLIRREMEERFARAGACFSEMQQTAQMGQIVNAPLANYFLQKYGHLSREERIAEMRKELRLESFKGVMIHEMGHALGMRHQFSSSWDSTNYMPQYWQLRTNEGQATASCEGKARDPNAEDSCMGPRYLDPHTLDEQGYGPEPRPMIEYFANTSTMEYQSERFSETAGLGTWDYHMTKAIYGRVLETYDNDVIPRRDPDKPVDQYRLASRMFTQLSESELVYDSVTFDNGSQPFGPDPFMHSWHYTKLNRALNTFNPERDCREATPEEKAQAKWRVVHDKVCQPFPRDYASWYDFVSDSCPTVYDEEPMVLWHTRSDLPGGNADTVRWSYRIGEHYSPTYVHTNMLDSGADTYEVAVNEIRNFNANYPSVYFRRHRRGSPPSWGAAGYAMDTFELLRSYHWSIANTNLRWLSFGKQYYEIFSSDDNWSRPDVMANTEIFNALASYVLAPQPGDYRPRAGDPSGVYDALPWVDPGADFTIQTIDGRYVDDAYDSGPNGGGSWEFEDWETRAGFWAEKAYAFLALCDSRPTLSTIAREVYLDDRGVKLNFRSDMPEAFDRLFGGMLAEDWQAIGMWVDNNNQPGQPAIPAMLDLMNKGEPTRPAGAKVLYPNLGYMQQLYASIFSALYARENTDMTLIHKMRIWIDGVEGNISDAAFPDEKDEGGSEGRTYQVRFYHPGSGFTYIARSFGAENIDGRQVDRGIASRMLQRANQLVTLSYVVKKEQGKPVFDKYGRPELILDAQGQPQPLDPNESKIGELTRYVGLIDAVRQLGHILGQGPY
ncbi:MAG TPA: hypothetical protein PKL24_13980 [Polyangiaceae bacterium]|jgi:hypothetical protein|nr:hypothetical protein [Polyangiaceae bacterium]HOD23320.1 hypothetical protein [Polyangiaceae bacterium]HOH01016.1 hypothetical protein [Polyangiaceae bacterium]HOR34863.1 hypothetical protein [Polyangiaceae bacterium]HPK93198.1 hypothetical protein [Polyangiaceae bacterium]